MLSRGHGGMRTVQMPQGCGPVAVGTRVTSRPPHRSVRAAFPHTAPTSGPTANPRRMLTSAGVTVSRFCARRVLCWPAFPLVAALGSTDSATDRSVLFAGFTATTAASDFPRPCIIGFGSSPSRCGPPASSGDGQTRDLPASDTILLRVICSSTPAGRQHLAYRYCSCCVRLKGQPPPPAIRVISWLNHTPHAIVVYASWPPLPSAHATLTSRPLAKPYLGRTCTG
jgi:hypothetical protein